MASNFDILIACFIAKLYHCVIFGKKKLNVNKCVNLQYNPILNVKINPKSCVYSLPKHAKIFRKLFI